MVMIRVARLATGTWGVLAVVFAAGASMVDNLIQAVNILGSLFYGKDDKQRIVFSETMS